MKHVAVLMGGWSAEREVSLRSGKACADALDRNGYRVTRIDVTRDIAAVLTGVKPDVALNLLHGRPGEDGTIQGMLEILQIPYSHSGPLSSALAMQKDVAKVVMANAGVVNATGDAAPDAWRRLVAYLIQSFAVTAAAPLPPPPTPRRIYRALLRLQPKRSRKVTT